MESGSESRGRNYRQETHREQRKVGRYLIISVIRIIRLNGAGGVECIQYRR